MLLKQKSSESQLKSVPVLTLWTKKLDFVPKIIKKRLQDLYFVLTLSSELGARQAQREVVKIKKFYFSYWA